ncbi:class I SAM-dependent methyltransferase [Nostoc sp.]|uniref:class I SAM-dependent methyltransferase n=1 Tax=Nostoc sp. TaxID=1180 RepID=UPI002FFAC5EA
MKQWYEELFENYADKYDQEGYTSGTLGEVDFIEKELDYDKNKLILDVGCGTGRHSLELARRGYSVTGIDLSESMLEKARKTAAVEKLKIDFIKKDARNFYLETKFDLSIMICEGAFPLMETDEMNFSILKNIYGSLKSPGKLILTTYNGLYPLFHSVKDFLSSNPDVTKSLENSFDLMTFRDHSVYETIDDSDNKRVLKCNERYYTPPEINWLLKSIGFTRTEIFGCHLGAFSRNHKLTTEDYEMLVVASNVA